MEAKPFASLTSGLLARKGQAKPAMRPQGFAGFGLGAPPRDDLGWNDMGYDVQRPLTPPATLTAAPAPAGEPVAPIPEALDGTADVPAVVRQRAELAQELAAHHARAENGVEATPASAPAPAPARTKRAASRKATAPAPQPGRKAAFTLRLDGERHLRLRLATAMHNRSAQQLVTEALDQFLAAIPELDDLAERVPARGTA